MIINLTQHAASPEQLAAGVVDLPDQYADKLRELLTFGEMPLASEVWNRARDIADLVDRYCADEGINFDCDRAYWPAVMIGGAPFLMGPLETVIQVDLNLEVLYAFSRRESVEEVQPDGSTVKRAVFRHVGFVEAHRYP